MIKQTTTICSICDLILQEGVYNYSVEAGCDSGIYLGNVQWWKCCECEGLQVEVPAVKQLHNCIAWAFIESRIPWSVGLCGEDTSCILPDQLNFVRKVLGLSMDHVDKLMGASDSIFRGIYLKWDEKEHFWVAGESA